MKQRLLYIIIGIAFVLNTFSQISYRTAELKRLASVMAIDVSTLKEGYNLLSFNNRPLVVIVKKNAVSHIGWQLFSKDAREAGNTPVLDFLERYFLQLNYPPKDMSARQILSDDQFNFLKGSLSTVSDIRPTDAFGFSYDKRKYVATWTRNNQLLLSVSFPVEYELISGENKIEAENNLMADIKNTSLENVKSRQVHSIHYINDKFSSKIYKKKGELLFSERHPAETVSNILLTMDAKGEYNLKVTQLSYGFRKVVFEVPLRQWIAFCQNNACQLYVGIEDINADGDVSAVVIAVNEAENYNHVLTITIPSETIQNKKGNLDARLYPYVPTHNVLSLFATYKKSNPKTIGK